MVANELDSGAMKRQEIDAMTTCSMCTKVFTDPKTLPCIHTFCMKCLSENGLKTNKGPGDEMPCPICRRMFQIPTEGFCSLQKDFFIERLIQMADISDQSSITLCDACTEWEKEEAGKEVQAAVKYCVDCNEKFCEECCKHHRKFKLIKNHTLVAIKEYAGGQTVVANPDSIIVCELHVQNVLDVYCADCKIVVCAVCFIDNHTDHAGSHVKRFMNGFRKNIESNAEAIKDCRSRAEFTRTEILKVKEDVQKRFENLERDVEKRKDELKQIAEEHATSLLRSLGSIRQGKLTEFQTATNEIDIYLSCLEIYNSYCKKILAKGSASETCRAFSGLSARAIELQDQCRPTIEREIQPFNFSFRKSKLEEILERSGDNWLGEFEGEDDSKPKKRSLLPDQSNETDPLRKAIEIEKTEKEASSLLEGKPENLSIIKHKDKRKRITGLAALKDKLFVASENSPALDVYDTTYKCASLGRVPIAKMVNPFDLASCSLIERVFIIDCKLESKPNEIIRIDPSGTVDKRWPTGKDVGNLSVSSESNIILSVYDKNKLIEYTCDGEKTREISLPSKVHPRHAIKLTNGHFLISHGFRNDILHQVSNITKNGDKLKLVKSFGEESGTSLQHLNEPSYLVVDEKGYILVLDRGNTRALLLDSNLNAIKEFLTKQIGLRSPDKICFCKATRCLFVVDSVNVLLVYNIK